jgi:ribonuclease HII
MGVRMAKPSLSELRDIAASGPPYEDAFLQLLRSDPRSGARTLYATCMRKKERAAREQSHIEEMLRFEREARRNGFERTAGVDEAGRGPLAGPIVAAAVVLCEPVPGLDDSKKLTPDERQALFVRLHSRPHGIGVQVLAPDVIDQYGIQVANYSVMMKAVAKLDPPPDFLLVDGFAIPGCRFPHKRIVKGDARSQSIAAASIVAKVVRDRIMCELDRRYPLYGFARHKGYATAEHLAAIEEHGPCPAHRMSFAPMARQPATGSLFDPKVKPMQEMPHAGE